MLEKLIPNDFSGVVSVKRCAAPLFQKAYGYADLPNKIPNQMDTRFETASAGKTFVAAAVMKLIEEGKLSLATKIGDVLDFDLKQIDPSITVRELLTHTSGIPDYFNEYEMEDYAALFYDYPNYKIRTSRDLLPLFIDKPMMYNRGERFQYNNTGYVVLGLILESVTGRPFDAHLASVLFEPLSMKDTGYYELDRLPAKCANSYIWDAARKEYYINIFSIDAKGTGAGGAFTTAADVERFWDGMANGKVVSRTAFSQMVLPHAQGGEYGYGFWVREDDQTPYFQGCDPGVSFISSCDVKSGVTVTLLSNFGCDVWKIHEKLLAEIAKAP